MTTTAATFAPILASLTRTTTPDQLTGPAATVHTALSAPHAPASGTMRAWMQAHDGESVHTVQVTNHNGQVWAPLSRTVDAHTRAGSVILGDSNRDYAGMRVLSAAPHLLIVADDWHTVAYIPATPTA